MFAQVYLVLIAVTLIKAFIDDFKQKTPHMTEFKHISLSPPFYNN